MKFNFYDWVKISDTTYIKKHHSNWNYDVVLNYNLNGYGWIPSFANKEMWACYKEYNPDYYITTPIDLDFTKVYIDKFLIKFSKLLVFL